MLNFLYERRVARIGRGALLDPAINTSSVVLSHDTYIGYKHQQKNYYSHPTASTCDTNDRPLYNCERSWEVATMHCRPERKSRLPHGKLMAWGDCSMSLLSQ